MRIKSPYIYTLLSLMFLMPTQLLASDPTGLFVFFVAIPLLILSFLSLITAFFSAIGGLVFALILLLFHITIFIWGYDVGYLDSAGAWVFGSFVLIIAALIIAMRSMKQKPLFGDSEK